MSFDWKYTNMPWVPTGSSGAPLPISARGVARRLLTGEVDGYLEDPRYKGRYSPGRFRGIIVGWEEQSREPYTLRVHAMTRDGRAAYYDHTFAVLIDHVL